MNVALVAVVAKRILEKKWKHEESFHNLIFTWRVAPVNKNEKWVWKKSPNPNADFKGEPTIKLAELR